jgi:phospholipase/carboxylesterase
MAQRGGEPDPHGGGRVLLAGEPLESATGAIIAVHGRGANPEDIVPLAEAVAPPGVAILAPAASGNTWYPYPFVAPIGQNEPLLSSALGRINELIASLIARGIPAERIAVLGFSQGACLALETAARHPRRYAGLIGFTGGLIGPPGTRFEYAGSLAGTPVFMGSSDVDPHIPKARFEETAEALTRLGARVDARLYPGMGHTVNRDEFDAARALLATAFSTKGLA